MCLELVSSKLSQVDRSAVPVPIWRVHPLRATRLLALRHQTGFDFSEKCKKTFQLLLSAGVHPVRRKEAFWRLHPVHGLGQALWLPAGDVLPSLSTNFNQFLCLFSDTIVLNFDVCVSVPV